jgi:uncharacterized iron-regulated membrane protein
MSMQSARVFLFRIHQWLGLNTCILLGIMFATGTLLVFSTEVENAFYAKIRSGAVSDEERLTFGQTYDKIQAAYPDARINILSRPAAGSLFGDRAQINTNWGEKALIWTDPTTGEILGATPLEGVRHILVSFHDSLFTGKGIGQAVVSLLAFSLLASIISGLIAYRRFWRALKTPPPRGRGARPWWGGLHRFAAVWSLPFLLTVAVSGIYYFIVVLGVIPTKGPSIPAASERTTALPQGFDGAMLDRAAVAAQAAVPEQNISAVVQPFNPRQGISFHGPTSDSPVSFGSTKVVVDPQSGLVLTVIEPAEFSPKDQAKHFFDALHHGDWAGNYSRAAWLVFGAMGTILMFSGAMVFASRIARMPAAGTGKLPAGSAPRRVWGGMFIAKWAMIPAAIIVAGIGVYRFGMQEPKWVTIPPDGDQSIPARLRVLGPVHAGEALPVRLIVETPEVSRASITWDGGGTREVELTTKDGTSFIRFDYVPLPSANRIAVQLDGGTGGPATLTWTLGRPIF